MSSAEIHPDAPSIVDILNDDPRFYFDEKHSSNDPDFGQIDIRRTKLKEPRSELSEALLLSRKGGVSNEEGLQVWLLRTDGGSLVGALKYNSKEMAVDDVIGFYNNDNPTVELDRDLTRCLQQIRKHHELNLDTRRRASIAAYLKAVMSNLHGRYLDLFNLS